MTQRATAAVDHTAFTEAELIAEVLAGPEPAAEIVACAQRLAALPFWERRALGVAGLIRDHNVPLRRARRLAALWELAHRWYPDERPSVVSSRDAVLLLDDLRRLPREEVVVLLLDARHRPLGREVVARGSLNASRLQPRDVLAPALRADAAAVIVAHNHPSGDPSPSRADRLVTNALRDAAALMGVALLDHIIVSATGHHSFRDVEGWDEPGDRAAA